MQPKGKLLIIGGAEDIGDKKVPIKKSKAFEPYEILKELLASKNKQIKVVTTGTQFHTEVKERYLRVFHTLNYPNPEFFPIQDKIEAHDPYYIEQIEKASAVFFTGGDQFRLSTILSGTPFMAAIKKRYLHDKDFLVAGTSAGAMVMSTMMIASGGIEEALFGDDLKISGGFDFLQNCIIDTHFIKRGRFSRLAHAVVLNSDQLGIGLGEDTALIITKGSEAECRGSGMVVIIDGNDIGETNITNVTDEEPIFVENLKVHLLIKGCRFSIKTRRLLKSARQKII